MTLKQFCSSDTLYVSNPQYEISSLYLIRNATPISLPNVLIIDMIINNLYSFNLLSQPFIANFFFFKLHEHHPKFLRTTNTFFMPLLSCSLSPNHQQNWSPNDLHTVISCHMMIWHFEILGTCMCVCVGSHYFLFPLPFPGLRVFKPSFVYLCFQVTLF